MKTILIATTNAGKRAEMVSAFQSIKNAKWLSLNDIPAVKDVEETGTTFAENALLKAKYYAKKTGLMTLGEDSGLTLNALPEQFGVRTRRQITAKNDIDWLRIFLEMMENETDRSCIFTSSMALFDPSINASWQTEGETHGQIVEFPMSALEPGIPVSSVFVPDGFDEVYSAMENAYKNRCSHRGKAAQAMQKIIEEMGN